MNFVGTNDPFATSRVSFKNRGRLDFGFSGICNVNPLSSLPNFPWSMKYTSNKSSAFEIDFAR
jgi:hypothetical protein